MASEVGGSEWRITERSVEVAQSRAFIWLQFAFRALDRMRGSGRVLGGLVTKSWSCVLALSHIRKCAQLAVDTATVPEARHAASAALHAFDVAVPRLQDARDFLEHDEDAYVLGTGDLQQPKVCRRKREISQSAAADWTFEPHFIDQDRSRPAARVGTEIVIDLAHACACAKTLQRSLYVAAGLQGLHPSGRTSSGC